MDICSVISCGKEAEGYLCENCKNQLGNRGFLPHMCWNCGSLIDIYEKPLSIAVGEVLFSERCRNCGDINAEKKKLIIKYPKEEE